MVAGLRRHISRNPKFRVVLGNGQECKIAGTGEVPDQLPNGNTITLHQVRHVLALKRSLVSIGMLAEYGYKTTLNESKWMISRGNLELEVSQVQQLVRTNEDQSRCQESNS